MLQIVWNYLESRVGQEDGATMVEYGLMVALIAVIVQGLLGGFRVRLHALFGTNLAVIHGCFAQLVFALLVCLAGVFSGHVCRNGPNLRDASQAKLPDGNRGQKYDCFLFLLVARIAC